MISELMRNKDEGLETESEVWHVIREYCSIFHDFGNFDMSDTRVDRWTKS